MAQWNVGIDTTCVLCCQNQESRDHLFFSCRYSSAVWYKLTCSLQGNNYTSQWGELVDYVSTARAPKTHLFLVCYVFQATIYMLWRERDARKHGENPRSTATMYKTIDRVLRNRLLSDEWTKSWTLPRRASTMVRSCLCSIKLCFFVCFFLR